jgi:hypothetical protein
MTAPRHHLYTDQQPNSAAAGKGPLYKMKRKADGMLVSKLLAWINELGLDQLALTLRHGWLVIHTISTPFTASPGSATPGMPAPAV